MSRQKSKLSNMKNNLHFFQYDFLEFRILNVDQTKINWDNLQKHPTIRNNYTLKQNNLFHNKCIRMFISNGDSITIRTSVPYLAYGHNYINMNEQELSQIITALSEIIGLDLFEAEVLQLEYGTHEFIDDSCKLYISQVVGVKDYDIKNSQSHLKMFGNSKGIHYKLYDAVANAKAKKTYSKGNYPIGKLIKHELKITDVKKALQTSLTVYDLCRPEVKQTFHTMLLQHHEQLCFQKQLTVALVGTSLSDIIYAGLKQMEQYYGEPCYKLLERIINNSDLSSSQKSKRRKTLMELETAYNT